MIRFSYFLLALSACPAMGPKVEGPQTAEQQLHGKNHVIFENDLGRPLCSLSLKGGQAIVDVLRPMGTPKPQLAPGAQTSFDAGDGNVYSVSTESCDNTRVGVKDDITIYGSTLISVGGKPHAPPPAGYTVVLVPVGGVVGGSESAAPATASCSPAYASEVDPTKCCSGKIDTKDKGSHYFCAP